MYHGWFRLCLSADGSTATAGEEEAPAPGHLPFWFKPVSAFGLLKFTTFISSSLELAMPSTLAPDRLSASSRRVLSRETRPPGSGEVTLSQELCTVGFLRPHVLVGYQWSHTGLCPGCRPVITATSAASCRTPLFLVCHRTRRFVQTKSIRFSPLAAAQPLTILSRPETLKAISSRRACWIAKSRDAYPFPYEGRFLTPAATAATARGWSLRGPCRVVGC
jgi:hypothetical protein